MNEPTTAKIFKVIPLIMNEVGAITKDRKNQQQGYAFRGIDDAYYAFQPLFAKHGMFVVPTVLETIREERENKSGGLLIYTVMKIKHTFYADDGSFLEAITVGEAMDSGDKSGNKCQSCAMKYALLEVFCVPTEADNDTENHSPEPAPRQKDDPRRAEADAPQPRSAPGTPPESKSAPQSQPEGKEVDWRKEKITFGKNAGKTLGELAPESLEWYCKNAEWKKDQDGVRKQSALGRALDAAEEEMIDAQSR